MLAGGFDSIKIINFNVEESYSIFTCNFPANAASLILIDPYDDFFPKYANKMQANLIEIITEKNIPVLLFVICKDSGEEPGKKWSQFRDWYVSANINLMSLSCSHFEKSTVRGEANYNFHSMLLMPQRYQLRVLKELESRIKEFSELLSKVLGKNIAFESNIMRSVAVSN